MVLDICYMICPARLLLYTLHWLFENTVITRGLLQKEKVTIDGQKSAQISIVTKKIVTHG